MDRWDLYRRMFWRIKEAIVSHNLGWKEAILEVLKRADAPMNCKDIADQISERDLRSDLGFTPANSVAAIIAISKPYPFRENAVHHRF